MKSSAKKVELAPYDDLFSTEESRQDAKLEKIQEIPLSELHPFKGHPFKVKDDEAMMETADSVRQYGVLVPAIARPDPEGGYELVAGHRRHRASELAEKETMPVIVRDLDDDAATIIMVDSNLQRESLLPSERAFAYKMKLEAMKHQGERMDLTCSQVGNKSAGKKSSELLAEQVGQSKNQIFRYIRLTELIPELLDMVDEKKIALNPAYELSFLKKEEQRDLLDAMDSEQATPPLSQAQRLKKYSQEGHLTLDMMRVIMGEEKKSDLDKVTFTSDTLRKYFPRSYTPQRMQETIRRILGLPKADVEDALELVGLTEFGDRLAKKYSLGMKQRLGLAGALLGRPPILILDEPTNGLDPSGIHEIRNLVKSLPSLYDCTVLISSHMLSEIELIADDIGILNHGRLLFEGSMNDLRQYALQSGFAADNLEDVFLSMVEKDNMDRKQRAKL